MSEVCWLAYFSNMVNDMNAKAAAQKIFTMTMNWRDWKTTFKNYLHQMPGRYGVPLNYVIRENDLPIRTRTGDLLRDYSRMYRLNNNGYDLDNGQVAIFILKFIQGNTTAEARVQSVPGDGTDGRAIWTALKIHYEGQGIFRQTI